MLSCGLVEDAENQRSPEKAGPDVQGWALLLKKKEQNNKIMKNEQINIFPIIKTSEALWGGFCLKVSYIYIISCIVGF